MNQKHKTLITHLRASGTLKTPRIIRAFERVDRARFAPKALQGEAYGDYPLPIGKGQTISQPTTVAFMLEELQPNVGQKILDVGSGSGWTTALLAGLIGPRGRIIGVEIVPELVRQGRAHLAEFDLPNAEIRAAGKRLGLPQEAPFDRILVSAAATELPKELVDQLASPGIMVLPIQGALWKITKDASGNTKEERFPGFVFVPLKT
jgi:protein-L-isoaspartate(D-aspartate) O-methyltransferase